MQLFTRICKKDTALTLCGSGGIFFRQFRHPAPAASAAGGGMYGVTC